MPPRYLTWAILVFWLATASWLFFREILPQLQTDPPPDFLELDYADEVRTTSLRWYIFQDDRRIGSPDKDTHQIGSGNTHLRRRGRAFELSCEFDFSKLEILGFEIHKITSMYRVGLKKELLELSAEVTGQISERLPFQVAVNGRVKDGRFTPRIRLSGHKEFDQTIKLPAVPVSTEASFLNPMHPLEKVRGLYEGRHWRMALVDPVGDALKAKLGTDVEVQYLNADVTSETLRWQFMDNACWVIDYRETGKSRILARTWVRKSDDMILRQEADFQGTRLRMERGPISR